MSGANLIHDAAWATAVAVMEHLCPEAKDREFWDRHKTAYEIIRAGLEAYEERADRRHQRLSPGRN